MARRVTPDPLMEAEAFLAEAATAARDDWRRKPLLHNARAKLDDALAALNDSEEVLQTQAASIAALMRRCIEQRRREIERLAAQLAELEGAT